MIPRQLLRLSLLFALVACSDQAPVPVVRLVTFGDSHVDYGIIGDSVAEVSYISQNIPEVRMISSRSPHSLAGKVERFSDNTLRFQAVNHGIAGTSTTHIFRGFDKEPNALAVHNGVTRFEAEVLGVIPWDGGTGKLRSFAFVPTVRDFVYVSLGTNDTPQRIPIEQTFANLRKMIGMWKAKGLPASHFLLATLPPNVLTEFDFPGAVSDLNQGYRALAVEEGITLIEVALKTSVDGGWVPGLTEDGIHYNESVNDWIAELVVMKMKELNATPTP